MDVGDGLDRDGAIFILSLAIRKHFIQELTMGAVK
jgi:hypothetical protein